MPKSPTVPSATTYRLSLYHCYLAERIRKGDFERHLTSRKLAHELNLKEETVRRDLSYVASRGRPGTGYDRKILFDALQEFLGLRDDYPILRVGTAQTLTTLQSLFPEGFYGLVQAAYYSELPEEAGTLVGDVEVQHIAQIPDLDPSLDVRVALVACSPPWIDQTLELLREAGITGVLLLTPKVRLDIPEGMRIKHVRMPCDIKSLACGCKFGADGRT